MGRRSKQQVQEKQFFKKNNLIDSNILQKNNLITKDLLFSAEKLHTVHEKIEIPVVSIINNQLNWLLL